MKIDAKRAAGYLFRAWYDEEDGTEDSGAPIDLVAFLEEINEKEAMISAAKGKLNSAMIVKMGQKAHDLGYTKLYFHRTSAAKLRWAKFIKSEGGMDYYTVDLVEALGL